MTLVECMPFSGVTWRALRGKRQGYDFVFGDEMSFVPFANDGAFLADHHAAGTPLHFRIDGQLKRKGIFYDLWENSLHVPQSPNHLGHAALRGHSLAHRPKGTACADAVAGGTFKAEFMTEFKEDKKATDNQYVYPNNTAAAPTWCPPTTAGAPGPWITLNSTAAPNPGQVFSVTTGTAGFGVTGAANTVTGPTYTGTVGATGGTVYREGPYTRPEDGYTLATEEGSVSVSFGEGITDEQKVEAIQAVAEDVVKETKRRKTTRVKGASFKDDDYTDPVT
jgi:hypothetical protein